MELPFLQSKLTLPVTRRQAVQRAAAISRLNEVFESGYKLALLSAPAGYGKTSLLASWLKDCAERADVHVAWLTLEQADDDPFRFWSYCLASLQKISPELAARPRSLLQVGQAVRIEALLSLLLHDLEQIPGQVLWALDDFHHIQSPEIHQSLAFFIEHLPPHIHLAIATRSDPFLPLPRLRARNELLELRQADLEFDLQDGLAFFHTTMALPIPDDIAAALVRRMEGWIAGMQLAALSMRGKNDLQHWLQTFAAGDQNLLEYFNQEVLSSLAEDRQKFIFSTAILERLNADLCRAVTGREDSQTLLEQFERENLFLTSLDANRTWFQFQPLFRDLLAQRLERTAPAAERMDLHRRAAHWFENAGWADEAISHALAAQENDQVARNLLRVGLSRVLNGEAASILATCHALPEAWLEERPDLLILEAWALLALARFDQVEPFTAKAEAALSRQPEEAPGRTALMGQLAAIRATAAFNLRETKRSIGLAHTALEWLPEAERAIRSVVMLDLADALLMQDQIEPASQRYLETVRLAHQSGNFLIEINGLSMAGRILSWQGKLRQAQWMYQQAIRVAADMRLDDLPVVGLAEDGLADLYLEWNDLEQARQWADKSLKHFQLWGHAEHILQAKLTHAEILRAAGSLEEAQAAATQTLLMAQQQPSLSLKRAEIDGGDALLAEEATGARSASAHIGWLAGENRAAGSPLPANRRGAFLAAQPVPDWGEAARRDGRDDPGSGMARHLAQPGREGRIPSPGGAPAGQSGPDPFQAEAPGGGPGADWPGLAPGRAGRVGAHLHQ